MIAGVTLAELQRWLETADWRMPLARPRVWNPEMLAAMRADWFAGSRSPGGALAGLTLYLGDWNRAHEIAQDLSTPEGSYWHGIIHRQEPDAWNSNYWFRRVGRHPVFPALCAAAAEAAARHPQADFPAMSEWRPEVFIDYCENARTSPGSAAEALAVEIQHIEWKMLFDYCRQP